MAHFDHDSGHLHLHVVYDGAPLSGKTTSVRALAREFGHQVETPEERDGRTLYFDWLDYAGGRYRNSSIRCRIIAVPGQSEWADRRSKILEAADAVVFVVDTTEEGFPATLSHFEDLKGRLRDRDRQIPIVLQLNKRDLPATLEPAEVRRRLNVDATHLGTTIATDGTGVRSTFVVAVGEAVRALGRSDADAGFDQPIPPSGELDLEDPASLFDRLTRNLEPATGNTREDNS